jgi:triosephosphate isomerase
MLASVGCQYTILGHSERRQYYGETDEKLVEKTRLALANGLDVILCVGENLEEREAGRHFEVCEAQIKNVLYNFSEEDMKHIIVAYEPVWAIGTGKVPTTADVAEMHAAIRAEVAKNLGAEVADGMRILYGGSVKPENAKELLSVDNVDGALIGGASLKADSFWAIAETQL